MILFRTGTFRRVERALSGINDGTSGNCPVLPRIAAKGPFSPVDVAGAALCNPLACVILGTCNLGVLLRLMQCRLFPGGIGAACYILILSPAVAGLSLLTPDRNYQTILGCSIRRRRRRRNLEEGLDLSDEGHPLAVASAGEFR